MNSSQELIHGLSEKLDCDQIITDMPTRIVHRFAHGPESLLHEDPSDFTPAVVVKPKSTEDVVEVVTLASEYEIPIVPQGGRTGTYGAEGMRDCIVLDLARMNRILDIDEQAYRVRAQAGVRIKDYNEALRARGYMSLEWPTMTWSSTIGARAAVSGYNKFENAWGGSAWNIKGIEVVLANGNVVELGRGSRIPAKNATAFDLMSLFLGSKGTFGVITGVTEQFIEIPEANIYGVWAFKKLEEATAAYVELLKSRYKGVVWRAKTYHKRRLATWLKIRHGKDWPEDVEMLTEYHLHGEPKIVKATEEILINIMKRHNGFWRDDIPQINELTESSHESIAVFIGMGSIFSNRVINGGMAYKLIPLDPIVPNSRLVEAYRPIMQHIMKVEDGKSYPALTGKLFVFEPGSAIPAELGYTKLWIVLNANAKTWNDEVRKTFKEWFADYAELIWSYDCALTGTHGFIPSEMQAAMVKKEIGEKEYDLMKTIKNVLDPKNIMNPKVRC
jgi:glycolate oxidase